MRGKAIYVLLTAVFILSHTVRAACQDTITDRPAVLRADIRDLAVKAFMYGLLDENGMDSLIRTAAEITSTGGIYGITGVTTGEDTTSSYIIPELESIRAQWEKRLLFLEKIHTDETLHRLSDMRSERKIIAERMLPSLLSIPETKEQFGPLTTEQALERIDELLGRNLAYEKKVASMSKWERTAWAVTRLFFGGSAPYNPKAVPMMNGLWYMPVPPGKPESFDDTIFWDDNFNPQVYKSSRPKPVISPEEMLK